ncbi:MAG: hypothetical protein C4518_07020 [Desulfobacteraceae bacterium]|nr:MAG: hypothetical protein C4518_07020 [Desulfobacteraceae bacterium]
MDFVENILASFFSWLLVRPEGIPKPRDGIKTGQGRISGPISIEKVQLRYHFNNDWLSDAVLKFLPAFPGLLGEAGLFTARILFIGRNGLRR